MGDFLFLMPLTDVTWLYTADRSTHLQFARQVYPHAHCLGSFEWGRAVGDATVNGSGDHSLQIKAKDRPAPKQLESGHKTGVGQQASLAQNIKAE